MNISEENQIWLNWIKESSNLRIVIEIGPKNRLKVRLIILENGIPRFITKKGNHNDTLDSSITDVKNQFAIYNLSKKIFPKTT